MPPVILRMRPGRIQLCLAFGLPLLQQLETARPKRPTAICLVPTRELATQVRDELAPLGEGTDVRVLAIYGGAPIEKQIAALNRGVELVVATPGRAIMAWYQR